MKYDSAIIKEQGIRFALVKVDLSVIQHKNEADTVRKSLAPIFHSMPIVLMALDENRIPVFQGREHIVNLLEDVDLSSISWTRYTAY